METVSCKTDSSSKDALHRCICWIHDCDRQPHLHRTRGHLAADESGADDQQFSGCSKSFTQLPGVVEGAHVVDASEACSWNVQTSGAHTGRDERRIELQSFAAFELDDALVKIEARCSRAQSPFGIELLCSALEGELGDLHVAAKHRFGQGRSVVWRVRLISHESEVTVEPGAAERSCRTLPSE